MSINTQIQNIRSQLRHNGQGITSYLVVRVIKELWDRVGVIGYGIGIVVLYAITNYLFTVVFGTTSTAFGAGNVAALATLVAIAYTSWIGFITYEEYTDRSLSRSIRTRPSIATIDDAFRLLQSTDAEARVNASVCLNIVVSTSPKNVVNTLTVPTEDIIEYLIPFLRGKDQEVSENISNVITFMARDYPDSFTPFQDELLGLIKNDTISDEIRGNVALTVGFLILSGRIEISDKILSTSLDLSEHSHPDVRIGACYMLAGVSNQETRQRLQEIAENDSKQEVREHAEELI